MSDYLPEALLLEIFLRLPSKSVLELRYVCKSWYYVVTDPQFVCRYNHSASKNSDDSEVFVRRFDRSCGVDRFTLHHNDDGLFPSYDEINLPLDGRRNPYRFIGSCRGLMCFDGFVFRKMPRQIITWNPSIGFTKTVMVRPMVDRVEEPVLGFGFDPASNDFKVVKIVFFSEFLYREKGIRDVHTVEVYDLSTETWRNITSDKAKPPCYMKESSWRVFCNKGIHWIGQSDRGLGRRTRRLFLAVFDLSEEVFNQIEMPNELTNEETIMLEKKQKVRLAVVNGSLGLFHYFIQWDKSPSFDGCCIWVMNEYGEAESWTKKYRVDLRLGIGKLVGVRKNEEVLVVTRHNWMLASFHPLTRKINWLGLQADAKTFYMDTYMESLAMYKSIANLVSNSRDVSGSSNASATANKKANEDEEERASTT